MAQLVDQLAVRRVPAQKPQCLVCGDDNLAEFLDLGRSPLANDFISPRQVCRQDETFPLRVAFCRACGHVQLLDRVPPEKMFSHYLYVSSASATLESHFHDLASCVAGRANLAPNDLVVDIGSNDGTLLAAFARSGVRTLGVDPAHNLAGMARAKGVHTVTGYFDTSLAQTLRDDHGQAQVVTATNSLPHISDLAGYFEGVNALLSEDGWMVIEAHYWMDLLDQCAFDTIYHEHVSYWALGPLARLVNQQGFEVVDVERLPLHHGQLRVWIRRRGVDKPSSRVQYLLAEEGARDLDRVETCHEFARRVGALRDELQYMLAGFRAQGLRVAGYGAPAKATTLLNSIGAGVNLIEFIADRSPLKQGRLVPGVRIPIVAPDRLIEERPDVVVILAWNFADEIMAQLGDYRALGGRFLLPIPSPRLV